MIFGQNYGAHGCYGQSGAPGCGCLRHLESSCYGFGAESPLARLITRTGSFRHALGNARGADFAGSAVCARVGRETHDLRAGEGFEPYDNRAIDQIAGRLADEGYPFQTAIYEIVRSAPFQMRRGELVQTETTAKAKEVTRR